jgi:phosphomethylpyrimidine synthase
VRISKENQEFGSGKSVEYAWDKPRVTAALTAEQRSILEQRGVLEPAEIHRLASKTKQRMGVGAGHKAACHSDLADDDKAHELQAERVGTAGAGR